jgi:aspartate aminotransferase
VSGTAELRKAIAEKLKNDNSLDFDPKQIVVSNGAKQSIANVILSLVDPGDEVIVPAPYWVSYPEMIKLAEGKMVEIQTTINSDFKITPAQLRAAITGKTKIFLLNSPCNPSGTVYNRDELEKFADVLAEHERIYIISDEIYEYINYSGRHESIAQFKNVKNRVIVINGVSKGFAMTGWRIGYMASSPEIAKACDTLQGQMTSGASSISQMASLRAVQIAPCTSQEISEMVSTFKNRRDILISKLSEIPGIKSNIPDGAFYVFPDVTHYFGKSNSSFKISNDNDLCMYLLNHAHVALVPGSGFGNPHCIRISYATSTDKLLEAVARIKSALAELS